MGNFLMNRDALSDKICAPINTFYSKACWIEGRAEDQLIEVAKLAGVQKVAAFPDLHPGKYGPVGCAVLADRLYPALAGNDIGCGMALFALDISPQRLKLNKIEKQFRKIGKYEEANYSEHLEAAGLPADLWQSSLGTIGGGNHFCEMQICSDCIDGGSIKKQYPYLLVHSGSRGLGNAIVDPYLSQGNISLAGADAATYLAKHDQAVIWARLNRQIIAERVAAALNTSLELICDNVHNHIVKLDAGYLHRKGAATAKGLVPLAGSRSTESYLLDTAQAPEETLASCAHGSGRKYDRHSMHGRILSKKSNLKALERNSFGGRVICEDKSLLIEEASLAYKSSNSVLADLESFKVAQRIATLQPYITFKKTREV